MVGRRKLGESVRGRPIMAYRLGERDEKTVVLISTMHGDEPRTRQILLSLRDGRPIRGVNLWVVPTYNPDGLARGTRKNAHGVDLNRNFPYRWADLDGRYESGPRPRSEPETRAVARVPRGRAAAPDPELPPAALRRRPGHQEQAVRPQGGPYHAAADARRSTAAACATAR